MVVHNSPNEACCCMLETLGLSTPITRSVGLVVFWSAPRKLFFAPAKWSRILEKRHSVQESHFRVNCQHCRSIIIQLSAMNWDMLVLRSKVYQLLVHTICNRTQKSSHQSVIPQANHILSSSRLLSFLDSFLSTKLLTYPTRQLPPIPIKLN